MDASSLGTERPLVAAWAMVDAWFDRPSEARERMAEVLLQLSEAERVEIEGALRQLQRWELLLERTERHLETRSLAELRRNVAQCLQEAADKGFADF